MVVFSFTSLIPHGCVFYFVVHGCVSYFLVAQHSGCVYVFITSINIAYYTAVAMLAGTSKIPRAYTLVLNCLKHVDPEH